MRPIVGIERGIRHIGVLQDDDSIACWRRKHCGILQNDLEAFDPRINGFVSFGRRACLSLDRVRSGACVVTIPYTKARSTPGAQVVPEGRDESVGALLSGDWVVVVGIVMVLIAKGCPAIGTDRDVGVVLPIELEGERQRSDAGIRVIVRIRIKRLRHVFAGIEAVVRVIVQRDMVSPGGLLLDQLTAMANDGELLVE